MKKTLYFSLIMLSVTAISQVYAHKVTLDNRTNKPIKFFAHLQAAPQRSKTVQPHSTESRDIREKCLDYIDFHVMYGDKTGEKITQIKGGKPKELTKKEKDLVIAAKVINPAMAFPAEAIKKRCRTYYFVAVKDVESGEIVILEPR